jgi:hypothetical protein
MRTRWTISLSAAALAIVLGSSAAFAQGAKGSVCKDGTKSEASGRGACSGHGGVDSAATAAAAKAAKSKGKAAAQVKCTDGTMSKGGQGACSGHGGIKKAADSTKAATKKTPPAAPAKKP